MKTETNSVIILLKTSTHVSSTFMFLYSVKHSLTFIKVLQNVFCRIIQLVLTLNSTYRSGCHTTRANGNRTSALPRTWLPRQHTSSNSPFCGGLCCKKKLMFVSSILHIQQIHMTSVFPVKQVIVLRQKLLDLVLFYPSRLLENTANAWAPLQGSSKELKYLKCIYPMFQIVLT